MGSRKPIIRKDEQFADMEDALMNALTNLEHANSKVQELLAREEAPVAVSEPSSAEKSEGDVTGTAGDSSVKAEP